MRLDNHTNPASGGCQQEVSHRDLSVRMKVQFRLLDVNKLIRSSRMQCHDHRQHLRRSETNIGNVDDVLLCWSN